MSLTAIIMMIIGLGGAILGALIGHPFSKAAGKSQGAAEATQTQVVEQAKAVVAATQERVNVDQKVAATPRADIDSQLSEFSRPD
jgi:hypothetical protein